jgi:hypothetical protein
MGFTFDDTDTKGIANSTETMRNLIAKDSRNAERIFPYIGGDEVLNHPEQKHHRFIISFGDLTEDEARKWPDLFEIVEERVKPVRIEDNRESYRKYWWQFAEKRGELTGLLQSRERILMHPFTASYVAFSFLPAKTIVSGPHNVFLLEKHAGFSVLQSRLHDLWTRFFSSSLEDRQRYTASDCFETFPFPSDWEMNSALEKIGRIYYEYRAALMVQNNEGLTKTYNRFHDPEECSPDILKLRELHAAMDRAVLDAYGWTDIPTACEFLLDYEEDEADTESPTGKKRNKKKPYRYRWPDEVRDEVLAKLLALNAERAEQERLSGSTGKKSIAKKVTKKKTPSRQDDRQDDLFSLPIQTPGLRELPTAPRIIEKNPNIYAAALVAALLHEAEGPLPWYRLRDAYILATSPRLMLSHALPDEKDRVFAWTQSWKQVAGPEHLLQAILNLSGRNLAGE